MSCYKFEPEDERALANIQSHLPVGWGWIAARSQGKKLWQLLAALAGLYRDMSAALCHLVTELNPYSTTELLPEWERAVGLPDSCFPSGRTIEERRADVVRKLGRPRYTLIETWRELARQMGIDATITPGDLYVNDLGYPYDYSLIYGGWQSGGRFRIYIEAEECTGGGYDYDYPLIYGSQPRCTAFACVIERIRPANVIVIWGAVPSDAPETHNFSDDFSEDFQ